MGKCGVYGKTRTNMLNLSFQIIGIIIAKSFYLLLIFLMPLNFRLGSDKLEL